MEEEVLRLALKDGYLTTACAGVCKRDRERREGGRKRVGEASVRRQK